MEYSRNGKPLFENKKAMNNYFLNIMLFLFLIGFAPSGTAQKNDNILWDAAWSLDNRYIAVGGNNKELLIFDAENLSLIKRFPIGSEIQRLSWHPTKNTIAIAAMGSDSRLIDIETGKIIALKETGDGTRAIAWNKDGTLLASANYDKSISIWQQDGTLVSFKTNLSSKSFLGIDWNPTKNQIITLSDSIQIFDAECKLLMKFKHRPEDVIPLCVKWHPSGDFFVVGDYGYENHKSLLQIWTADGVLSKQIEGSKAEYRNISWTKDGNKLATASDALRIWSKNGTLLYETPSEDLLWGVSWSNDQNYIVTSSFKGHIKVWDKKGKLIKQLEY